jgi:dihydroxyacetone kinase
METSKMKKLINKGEDVVEEMIQGVVSSFPNLRRLGTLNVILRADALDEEVFFSQ